MGWVQDNLKKRDQTTTQSQPQSPAVHTPEKPASQNTWEAIKAVMQNNVLEFNEARGAQFTVGSSPTLVQITPKQPPNNTVVVELENRTVSLTCPISGQGLPRRGTFKIEGDRVRALDGFVGKPAPPSDAMTVEQFSRFALEPLLFPELQSEA